MSKNNWQIHLRQQIVELVKENMEKGCLDAVIGNIKATVRDKGQHLFAMLRDFQLHLEAFQREQEEINRKLQRLVDRGESLHLEDLRQLEAAEALQNRQRTESCGAKKWTGCCLTSDSSARKSAAISGNNKFI